MARGRGGGRGRGGRGGPRGGGRGRSGGRTHVLAPSGDTSIVLLKAEVEFWEKLGDRPCPATVVQGGDEAQCVQLKLESWKDLAALLSWFRDGLAADEAAELSFSPKLNKQQRALVHSGAEGVGLGGLDSVSRGVGDDRYVTVLKKGRAEAQRPALTEKQEHKAYWLWRWAQQAGYEVSRDEVAEMVRDNALKHDLAQLWAQKSAQQKALQQLCAACAAGDVAAIRSLVEGHPGLLAEEVYDLHTGVAPLHVATKTGQLAAMQLLLELGAGLEWKDGAGLTALQISRKFDQSDAEGVLLRAGAADPDAPNWPGEAALPPAAGATAASTAAPAAGADGPAAPPAAAAAAAATASPSANGLAAPAVHQAPLSAASEGGDSESVVDSAASVCGTDMSRNVGDVGSIAGDTIAESEAATSPRAPVLEAVGEQSEAEGEEAEGEQQEEEEREGSEEAAAPPPAAPATAANGGGGGAAGQGGAAGALGALPEGQEEEGGEQRAPSPSRGRRGPAEGQGQLLADYLTGGRPSEKRLEDADVESTRSVCGSEMTYQQSLDIALQLANDGANPPLSPSAPAAATAAKAAAAVAASATAASAAAVPAEPAAPREASCEIRPASASSEGAEVAAPKAPAASKGPWALTGRPEVDAVLTEWGEWASEVATEHRGAVLAGAAVVAGLALVLGIGGGRRR